MAVCLPVPYWKMRHKRLLPMVYLLRSSPLSKTMKPATGAEGSIAGGGFGDPSTSECAGTYEFMAVVCAEVWSQNEEGLLACQPWNFVAGLDGQPSIFRSFLLGISCVVRLGREFVEFMVELCELLFGLRVIGHLSPPVGIGCFRGERSLAIELPLCGEWADGCLSVLASPKARFLIGCLLG